MSIKLRRPEECEQLRTSTEKLEHSVIFSREIFHVTIIVLCLNVLWLKAVNEITAVGKHELVHAKMPSCFAILTEHRLVTDRQTDTRRDQSSRGKNAPHPASHRTLSLRQLWSVKLLKSTHFGSIIQENNKQLFCDTVCKVLCRKTIIV